MKRGKFVIIEGPDGCGKSICIEHLKENLGGKNIVFTKEPGGTNVGRDIRAVLLNRYQEPLTPLTELFLFFADRAEHLDKVVRPALRSGKNVISDRFNLSTIAYQIYGRQQLELKAAFEKLNELVVADTNPDFCVLLELDPDEARKRMSGRDGGSTRFDEEEFAFHRRVMEGFKKEVGRYPHAIVDAGRPKEIVVSDVMKVIQDVLISV